MSSTTSLSSALVSGFSVVSTSGLSASGGGAAKESCVATVSATATRTSSRARASGRPKAGNHRVAGITAPPRAPPGAVCGATPSRAHPGWVGGGVFLFALFLYGAWAGVALVAFLVVCFFWVWVFMVGLVGFF